MTAAAPVACPNCGGPLPADAASCRTCGELLRLGTGTDRRSYGTTADPLWAAVRDWPRKGPRLAGLALFTAGLWFFLFAGQTFGGFAVASVFGTVGAAESVGFFVGYAALAVLVLPVNCGTLLGLHRVNLRLARDERVGAAEWGRLGWLPWSVGGPGKARLLVCGGVLAFFAIGIGWAGAWMVDTLRWELLLPGNGALFGQLDWVPFAAAVFPAAALWTLFWPLPYLILDRPDLRGLRPLRECWNMAAEGWGGHVVTGVASAALLTSAIAPWGALLPVLGPLTGLITAYAYVRRAAA